MVVKNNIRNIMFYENEPDERGKPIIWGTEECAVAKPNGVLK